MGRSQLAVVIPCHNEAATLGPVVTAAARSGDVVVVDDRSTDASATIAAGKGAWVIPAAAPGYDGAIDTGLRYAFDNGYGYVITLDADGEHDPGLVAEFHRRLEAGADLVCGYRKAPQRWAEHIAAALGISLLGVRDLLCGMKGYGRPVLAAYFQSGAPLLVNMAPAVLWRKAGRPFDQLAVTGARRADRPRFGRALAANWAILMAMSRALRLRPPEGLPANGATWRGDEP